VAPVNGRRLCTRRLAGLVLAGLLLGVNGGTVRAEPVGTIEGFESWSMIALLDVQNLYNDRGQVRPRWIFADQEIVRTNGIGILPSLGLSAEF
jgi:hypothetical protein